MTAREFRWFAPRFIDWLLSLSAPVDEPRLFPLDMSEAHVRARVKAYGMYGDGQVRPWEVL